MPKHVFLLNANDFEKFDEAVQKAAGIVLYSGWIFSSRVGGSLFEEVRKKEPENEDIVKMLNDAKKQKGIEQKAPGKKLTLKERFAEVEKRAREEAALVENN